VLIRPLEKKIFNRVQYICSRCGKVTTSFLYGTDYIGLRGQAHLKCKKCGYDSDTVYVERHLY